MPKEIERKYLLQSGEWKNHIDKKIIIKQGYLSSNPDSTVRIRLTNDKAFLTIKSKTIGITRSEYEYAIPIVEAEELLHLCTKPLISKTRYIVIQNKSTWEVDIFEGENEGLEVAEIELVNPDQIIEKPNWLGEEVSNDPRYYNSSLAKHPFKDWDKIKP